MNIGATPKIWLAGAALAASFAPVDIGYGLIVFQVLGPGFEGLGVASGWLAVLVSTALVGLVLRSGHIYTSVRPAQTLSIAALLGVVLTQHPHMDASATAALGLASVMVVATLSGLIQWAMGAAGVGKLVSFVPRPVLSGVSTAAAVGLALKALSTLWALFMNSRAAAPATPEVLQVVAWLAFVCAALLLMTWAARHLVFLNWSLLGLLFGIALYALADTLFPANRGGPNLGPTLPHLDVVSQAPVFLTAWHWLYADGALPGLLTLSLPYALVVAIVNSLEALVYNARFERTTEVAHDPARLLIALGMGNTLAGLAGGLPVSLSNTKMTLAWNSGVRCARGMSAHCVMLLVLIGATALYVHHIPKLAVSLVMLYLAWMMLDAWSKRQLSAWLRPRKALQMLREPHSTAITFLVVVLTAVLTNLVWGVTVGLLCAVFVFVQRQSLNIIRRSGDLADRRSVAMRNEAQHRCLREHAHRVLFLELQGALFFGTSEQLLRGVRSRLSTEHTHVLLDMRRVLELDDAGCETIERLQAELAKRGGNLLVSACSTRLQWRSPQEVHELAAFLKYPIGRSLDEILEIAEDALIARFGDAWARADVCDFAQGPTGSQLLAELSAQDRALCLQQMTRCEFPAGSVIFQKDQPSDAMYLIICGRVDIWLNYGFPDAVRLASFRQGVTFGEMGLLRDKPRTADAVAVVDVVALKLDRAGLAHLQQQHPAILTHLLIAISQELAYRLGRTNRALRAVLKG